MLACSPLEIVHNLWYSAPLLLSILICIISWKAEILKSPCFCKRHRGLETLIIPNSWPWKWNCTRVIWSFMPLFALWKKEKPVCFLTLKKIVHVAGFGGIINAEELTYKMRPPVTLGRLLTRAQILQFIQKSRLIFS